MFVCEHRCGVMCADGCVYFGENTGDHVCVFVHIHDYMCVYVLYVSVCFYLCIIGGYVEMYVPMYMSVSMCACVHTRHV